MMKTFTAAHRANSVTPVTKPTLTKGTTSLPPEPHAGCNENLDPNATPPSSPSKPKSPSTPLHRRFLQEVTMSSTTPPRTPTRNKRDTPTTGRDSPANGRESPTKQKLTIGQNGFYFSCELPISKVTPKKNGTPNQTRSTKKDDATDTPTKRTPSPLKKSSPVKKSPTRVLFGTPTPKTGAPTSRANTPIKRAVESNESPTKSAKMASRLARGPSSTPVPTLRIPPECLKDVTEEEVVNAIRSAPSTTIPATTPLVRKAQPSSSLQPSNIGQLMASLGSSKAHKTRDWAAVVEPAAGTAVSPAPTPLRRASEKLRLSVSPTFVRITARHGHGSTSSPAIHLNVPQPPMPQSSLPNPQNEDQLADTEPPGTSGRPPLAELAPTRKSNQTHNANVANGTQTEGRPLEPSFEPRTALDMVRQEQVQEHPPPLFPQPECETGEEGAKEESAQLSKKQVKWQKLQSLSSKTPKSGIPTLKKRAGTDPAVLQAMREEMVKAEASLRRSTGHDYFFRGPVNNNELPAMSNTVFEVDQEAKKPGPMSTPSISRKLSRTNSDTSSIGTVRASMVMSAQKRNGTQSVPSTPRPLSHITTPASARREQFAAAKQADSNRRDVGLSSIVENERIGPKSAASIKSHKGVTSAVRTSQQLSGTPRSMNTPSRSRVRDTVVHVTPGAMSAQSKAGGALIPRGARKSVFDTPTRTKVTPAKTLPPSTRKPLPKTPLSTSKRIQPRPVTPKPYDPATDPRPYEKKFASAVDIAGRVAAWNSEDRKKAVRPAPTPPRAIISPTKKAAKPPHRQKLGEESHTPLGSPTKLPSPVNIAAPDTHPSPAKNPAHPRPTPTPTPTPTPVPNPPKTPGPRKTAVNRIKDAHMLKTPAGRRIPVPDRNALRTPSKAIESSLDRAIDAKIEEDARSGKEFTPSGNRVRDLLEARGWKGVGM